MKVIQTTVLALGLLGSFAVNAAPLVVNPSVVGKPSERFIAQLDDQMSGYVRGYSYQKASEFRALEFVAMLNQTANIEKKLDVLIAEMRENNRLLKAKK